MHLDQQVPHPIGVERREEVLDGADALPFSGKRGGVVGLRHGADVGRDLDSGGQGDEVDAAVRGQRLENHRGALAGVQAEAVDHGRVVEGALAAAGLGEQRQVRGGGEPALGLATVGAGSLRHGRGSPLLEGALVFESAGRGIDRPLVGEGLLQVVVGPHLDRLHRGRGRAVPRHHDHGRRGVGLAQRLQGFQAVAVGQPDVEEDHRRALLLVEAQRALAAGGGEGRVPLVGKDASQGGEDPRLVVHDQNQLAHAGQVLQRKNSRG